MTQLALKLRPAQTKTAKARHLGTAKHYAKRYARTKNPVIYRLMILHLKAGLQ